VPTTYDERAAAPTRWSADAEGTSVDFAVKTFWGLLTVRGHVDRFGGSYEVDSTVAQLDHGRLEIEATTTVDQRRLGMSSGRLRMVRRPATVHVKAALSDAANGAAAKERS
jgi:hypothetical protein